MIARRVGARQTRTPGRWGSTSDAEDAPQIRLATKDLRHLRTAFRMAQEMGQGLERGAVLQRSLPTGRAQKIRTQLYSAPELVILFDQLVAYRKLLF